MKRIAVNSGILTLANVGTAALGFVLAIIIGRALGVDGFGRYALALAWAAALGLLADFGLATLLTRDLARSPQHLAPYMRSSTIFKTGLSLILIIGLVLAAPLLTQDAASVLAIRLAAPLVWLSALYMSFTAIFRASQRMTWILLLNVGALGVQVVGALVLAARGAGAVGFVLLAVAIQGLQLSAAWLVYLTAFNRRTSEQVEQVSPLRLARAASPFAVAAGIGAVQLRAPLLLLGALSGDTAVGLYSAAARFSEALKLIPGGFFGAFFPALSQLAGQGAPAMEQTFRRAERGLLAFAFACALGLTLAAAPLVSLTYGTAFASATPILVVLAWALVPYFWGTLMGLYLYAVNDERFVNRIRTAGIGIQLVVSIPLMLAYGALGAALAVLLGEGLMAILYRWRCARVRQNSARPHSPQAVVPSLPAD